MSFLLFCPLAYGLARAEDCNIEDIKSAICIIDTALGKAGVTAVVRDSESAELASALILAADVIKVMGAGDVLAEDMAKEFEGYNNSLSSSISGHLLAEEIFNWARGILVTKASRSRD